MKFPKAFLLSMLELSKGETAKLTDMEAADGLLQYSDSVTLVETIDEGKVGRWSIGHTMVFRIGTKHFQSFHTTGATESQDESPYEYEGDEVECPEVKAVPVTTMTWVPVAPPAPPKAPKAPANG